MPVVLTTLPTIFSDIYHESSGILGLHYISLVSVFSSFYTHYF